MVTALRVVAAAAMIAACSAAMAQQRGSGFDSNRLFFGAGISQNDIARSDDGTGYQFFGGYEFGEVAKNIVADVEVGYMNTGNMDLPGPAGSSKAKGLWTTGVGRLVLNPQWELLGRAGIDFGDDDGFMLGVGAGFHIDQQSTLRFELVERDEVSSLQVNFVYRP